jgi:hypothetical protein
MTQEQIVDNVMALHAEILSYISSQYTVLHVSVKAHATTGFPVYHNGVAKVVKPKPSAVISEDAAPEFIFIDTAAETSA